MSFIQLALTFYTLFGSFLTLLLAVLQITAGKGGRANLLRFIHFLCSAFILLDSVLIANRIPINHPFSVFLYPTCCLLLGPSYYFSINALTGTMREFKRTHLLHLVPAALMLIAEIAFYSQGNEQKRLFISGFLTQPLESSFAPIFIFLVLHIFLYHSALLKDMLPFWNNTKIHKEARIVIIRLFLAMATLAVFSTGIFLTNSLIMLAGLSISATVQISIPITQDYYPSFFFAIKKEVSKKRYERSRLQGLDTELIKRRLDDLMKDEEIYKDAELTLHTLAEKLSISPHQLSQFLNDQLQLNFCNYVNGYRVRAARQLLETNPGLSITTICYEVGFNAKSVFYTSFNRDIGLTPQAYRSQFICSDGKKTDTRYVKRSH